MIINGSRLRSTVSINWGRGWMFVYRSRFRSRMSINWGRGRMAICRSRLRSRVSINLGRVWMDMNGSRRRMAICRSRLGSRMAINWGGGRGWMRSRFASRMDIYGSRGRMDIDRSWIRVTIVWRRMLISRGGCRSRVSITWGRYRSMVNRSV